MAVTGRELVINITTTNTWTQLLTSKGGAAYTAPVGGRFDISTINVQNRDASDSVTIEIAISANGTIDDDEHIWPYPIALAAKESARDDDRHIAIAGEGLWARAVGTTPNVTVRATGLEMS
jgi:hypothetical protein